MLAICKLELIGVRKIFSATRDMKAPADHLAVIEVSLRVGWEDDDVVKVEDFH